MPIATKSMLIIDRLIAASLRMNYGGLTCNIRLNIKLQTLKIIVDKEKKKKKKNDDE